MKKLVIYASLALACLFGTVACEEPTAIDPDYSIAPNVQKDSTGTANCQGENCDPPPCTAC